MASTDTYYPRTNDGRAAWWQNIFDNGTDPLTTLGFNTNELISIMADAQWAVYAYATVRQGYDEFLKSVTQYADGIVHGTPNGSLPVAPTVPTFPTPPGSSINVDIEARREMWVQQAKSRPNYNSTVGAALGIDTPVVPFDPATYKAQLYGLSATNAQSVSGKFRKANGHVDSINLYGRKDGATPWTLLGRFTATPFTASVPVPGPNPEEWEFQARAVRRDAEFGLPSDRVGQIVRP